VLLALLCVAVTFIYSLTLFVMQGVRKTKLGLREFVKLGDFQQIIDTQQQQAVGVLTGAATD
jgi:hypothetical protein